MSQIEADRAAMAPGEWETRVRIFEMLECAAARVAAQQEEADAKEGRRSPTKSTATAP